MFHVFLEAKIGVAIVEVRIGGENDCTNVIKSPYCTGITSLALDHTSILGDTIDKIAFHKSEIFKTIAPALTVPQSIEAMLVLEKRAAEKNCIMKIVPSLENYDWVSNPPDLGIPADIQKYNASLALQLSSSWIDSFQKISRILQDRLENIITNSKLFKDSFSLEKTGLGISSCKWPGRTQILRGERIDFFIDGAHTLESINCCTSWFRDRVKNESGKRFLIFNATGNRDPNELMNPFRKLEFFKAIFSPNIAGINNVDQQNWKVTNEEMKVKCRNNCEVWGEGGVFVNNVVEAINYVLDFYNSESNSEKRSKPKVLVTGSLHLVGALLFIIDPSLNMTSKS